MPNFRVGRISVSDALEAEHVVTKIIDWYNGLAIDESWFGKVYFAGGDPHTYHYLCAELNITEAINQGSFSGMNIKKCFHTDGTHIKSIVEKVFTEATQDDDDAGFIYHLDHGTGYSIYLDGDDITIDDLMGIGGVPGYSDQQVPVVFSVSCGNGSFDLDLMSTAYDHSFGEAMLKSSGGGVAYIGGSRTNTGDAIWHYEAGNLVIDDTTLISPMLRRWRWLHNTGQASMVGL